MRTFNETLPCQSSLCLDNVNYKLKKLPAKDGNGFIFTVDCKNCEPDSIHITSATLKALYLLITSNEDKK